MLLCDLCNDSSTLTMHANSVLHIKLVTETTKVTFPVYVSVYALYEIRARLPFYEQSGKVSTVDDNPLPFALKQT